MSDPVRYSQKPVELPLDPWLLEGVPALGCKQCAASDQERSQALKQNDWRAACAAARDVRRHHQNH